MEPFEDHQLHDTRRRIDAVLVWTAIAGAFVCSAAIVVATYSPTPDPVAEPVPSAHWPLPTTRSTTTAWPSTTNAYIEPESTTSPRPVTTTGAAGTSVPLPTTTAALAPQSTTIQLWSVGEHKCLSTPTGTDTGLRLHTCDGQRTQAWQRTSTGQLTAVVGGTTQCMDATGQRTRPGTKVIIWPCNGQANQRWSVNSDGTITGVQSGLCLDVSGAAVTGADPVALRPCDGDEDQRWEQR